MLESVSGPVWEEEETPVRETRSSARSAAGGWGEDGHLKSSSSFNLDIFFKISPTFLFKISFDNKDKEVTCELK